MNSIWGYYGLARSILIYYGVPFRLSRLTRFYRQFIRPGELCFDIGAHVGNHLYAMSKLGGNVIAVEPQPNLMQFLRRWYKNRPNVVLIENAVGETIGNSNLFTSTFDFLEDLFDGLRPDQRFGLLVIRL